MQQMLFSNAIVYSKAARIWQKLQNLEVHDHYTSHTRQSALFAVSVRCSITARCRRMRMLVRSQSVITRMADFGGPLSSFLAFVDPFRIMIAFKANPSSRVVSLRSKTVDRGDLFPVHLVEKSQARYFEKCMSVNKTLCCETASFLQKGTH